MIQPAIKVLLAGISALGIVAAALTISPSSHDFGKVGVLGLKTQDFVTTLPPGPARPTRLIYAINGPDAVDFIGPQSILDPFGPQQPCPVDPQGVARCTVSVEFRPRSVGPKSATLYVTDNLGNHVTAALRGTAVLALCTHTVVPCNYALHYSGVVSWSGGDAGANVDVVQGVASCNASGDTELTSGPGLVAVEFGESEDAPSPFYRITVACPTRYPPEPARPAELGHGEFGSYKQPLGMTIADVHKGPPRLKGSDGEVSWNLCPDAQYVRAPRDSTAQGPHDPCPDPPRRAP